MLEMSELATEVDLSGLFSKHWRQKKSTVFLRTSFARPDIATNLSSGFVMFVLL